MHYFILHRYKLILFFMVFFAGVSLLLANFGFIRFISPVSLRLLFLICLCFILTKFRSIRSASLAGRDIAKFNRALAHLFITKGGVYMTFVVAILIGKFASHIKANG